MRARPTASWPFRHRSHPATRGWLAAVGLVVALTLSLGSARGAAVSTHALPNRQLIQVHWVRVDPMHPRTLFASGAGFCHVREYPPGYLPTCPLWLMRSLSDRIIVLHNGALVADGEPAAVIASPVVQEAYLGVEVARD
jgi:hypothetical protein